MKHHLGVGFHWEEPALFSQPVWGQPSTSDGEHIKSSWGGRLQLFTTSVGVSSLIAQVLWVHSSPAVLKHRCHASIHKEQRVNTYKLVAEDPAGTHWPPVCSQRKSNCNWWWRCLIKRHFSPFWGQADPDSMQEKASAPQHCESALTYCPFDAFLWFFFSVVPAVVSGENHETPVLSCTPVDMRWCYIANGHGCYFGINAYYRWRTQQWLMCNWLEAGRGSSSWVDEHRWSSGHQQWALVTKARTYIFHSNRKQTSVTVIYQEL